LHLTRLQDVLLKLVSGITMNSINACPTSDRLLEMASGNVSTVQAEELVRHLDVCSDCNAAMAAAMERDPLAKLAREAGWPPVPMDHGNGAAVSPDR
jgi:hypothetical protein